MFENRRDAGRQLADELTEFDLPDTIVLALPRGGVVVGYEVASFLGVALDVLISRKVGAPGNPELAVGAVAEIGGLWADRLTVDTLGVPPEYLREEVDRQLLEIDRMIKVYRQGRELPPLDGRTVIVVDDGVATGYTMLAAVKGVREAHPKELVAATPLASQEALWRISREADRTVCLMTPQPFYAVGYHFSEFDQLTDEDVVRYLQDAQRQLGARRE